MDWAIQTDDLASFIATTKLKEIGSTLRERYNMQRPATRIGTSSLLVLGLQETNLGPQFDQASEEALQGTNTALLPPHVKQLASDAFHQMISQKQDQSIVFIGKEGSGKSINRLALSSQLVAIARNGKKKSKVLSGATKMELALEAFGTFKGSGFGDIPGASDYSSGYGRYTEYQYSSAGRMIGVKLLDYGFSKTRVFTGPSLAEGSRTFHVFYQLLAGASPEERAELGISDVESFTYTKGANPDLAAQAGGLGRSKSLTRKLTITRSKSISKKGTTTASSSDARPLPHDAAKFQQLRENLKSLGVGKRTQTMIYKVLAAILHLGNIVFADDDNKPQEPCLVKNPETLAIAAKLLSLSTESLQNAILYKSKTLGKDTFSTCLQAAAASDQRDALAATLYSLLFTWLIEHINERLCKEEREVDNFIGVLDFPWIQRAPAGTAGTAQMDAFFSNYALERLFHYTQTHNFDEPMTIFSSQSIPMDPLSYPDNQFVVDLFDGTPRLPGLWSLLEKGLSVDIPPESTLQKEILANLDATLKPNPHFVLSSNCINGQKTMDGPAQPVFGVAHYCGNQTIEYNIDSFIEQDAILTDFVALFGGEDKSGPDPEGSEKTFLATLFSKKNGLRATRTAAGRITGTKKSQEPLRKPSMKGKRPAAITEDEQVISATHSLQSLLDSLKKTRHWNVFCVRATDQANGGKYNDSLVNAQITSLNIKEYVDYIAQLDVEATAGITYEDFIRLYGALVTTVGGSKAGVSASEQVQQFISNRLWPAREIAFGSNMLFLSINRWRWIYTAMKRIEGAQSPNESVNSYEHPTNDFVPAPFADEDTYSEYSDSASNQESEFHYADEFRKRKSKLGDAEAPNQAPEKKEIITKTEEVTRQRKLWVCCTWMLTWWFPSFCLSICGGMKRPDIRMAWREKLALCIIIFFMCMGLLFLIIGLRYVICPPQNVLTQSEVYSSMAHPLIGGPTPYFSVYGTYILASRLMDSHIASYGPTSGPAGLPSYVFTGLYGSDVSIFFYRQDNWATYCPNLPNPPAGWDNLDSSLSWQNRNNPSVLTQLLSIHRNQSASSPPRYVDNLFQYAKGKIGWSMQTIQQMSSSSKVYIVLNSNVYYVNQMQTSKAFSQDVLNLFSSSNFGTDITGAWNSALAAASSAKRASMLNELQCINNMFYIGTVDTRNSLQCSLSSGLLFGASIVLVLVIGIKFLAALQFGTKKMPEDNDKFVIMMVPCYTEGVESLTKTLDSLATFQYDDKRKLLFVICDGMIIGSGNDRPTPRIVLDILGVDANQDPEPQCFHSLGEGNKQYNMAKIYSGLYEIKGHSVPFIVVVKCGSRTERVKPGNRGKRDSQLILMRFLNRVHFNADFNPMELEIYHQMKNVIGVSPSYYEFVLMVDADTEAEPGSLNRMVSVMIQDSKIMGLCGETRISNEKESWVTMIQVYEYFISHHMAKAFESLFGTVTCLPGCFSIYRIRTGPKNIPVLVSPGLLVDYSENSVDTLHKKNLLHLGEDRYLTTLLLKHFPNMRTKFTAEARCHTVVPEKWSVLLSQRRRWINSTVHNLLELFLLDQLCGFCCFSMRFIVLIDLFATFVQPATILYILYLIYAVTFTIELFPVLSIILLAAIYGFQVVIFIIKREWQHIMWMFIYLAATPIISFWIPCYSFWHFDDFSWGNTRVVVDDGKKTVYVADTEPFDPKSIPLKKWKDFEEQELWDNESIVSGSTVQSSVASRSEAGSVVSYDAKRQRHISMMSFGGGQRSSTPNISDELLYSEIQKALVGADLMTLTKKQIRENLSAKLGVDLRSKKEIMNSMIDEILAKQM